MKILLSSSTGSKFAEVDNFTNANVAAKAVFKCNYWSDLYYDILFDDGTQTAGSIDLEPQSFHKPHQNIIFTNHLKTWWGNVSRITPNEYGFMKGFTQEDIDFCKKLLTYLPKI